MLGEARQRAHGDHSFHRDGQDLWREEADHQCIRRSLGCLLLTITSLFYELKKKKNKAYRVSYTGNNSKPVLKPPWELFSLLKVSIQ